MDQLPQNIYDQKFDNHRWRSLFLWTFFILLFLGIGAYLFYVYYTTPNVINLKGTITGVNGAGIANGKYNFLVRIYNSPSGDANANLLYTEKFDGVKVENGVFTIRLSPPTSALPDGNTYLQICLDSNGSDKDASIGCGSDAVSKNDTRYDLRFLPRKFIKYHPYSLVSKVLRLNNIEANYIIYTGAASNINTSNISEWNTAYSWGNHASVGYLTSESDPVFTSSPVGSITSTNISNWNTAFGWGNHATAGYLTSESDPIFSASPAAGITSTDISNWNTAYSWGNHATAGSSESDPIFSASPAAGITSTDISNWNTAYGWGDHSLAGYLTSYTETDPVFSASPSAGITAGNITNWNTAYSWGNHASAGYLTSESDPVFGSSPSAGITGTDISNWNTAYSWGNHATAGYLTSESDPIFSASPAAGITSTDISNWNTAFGWGNHAAAGYLTSESDPIFSASPTAGITSTDISNWNTAYSWGNHATASYLTSESDPIFSASPAAGITSTDISNWNTAYSWGNHATAGYLTSAITSINGLTNPAITLATGSAGSNFNIAASGSTVTFNIPDASATARGLVNTGAQTFAGTKTFTAAPAISTMTPGSVLFAGPGGVVSQNNANFFWNNTNNRLGIRTINPAYPLDVNGDIIANGWIRTLGNTGLYSDTYGRGIAMPEATGNPYGNIATYNGGRNDYVGYGLGWRYSLIAPNDLSRVGLRDNSSGGGWRWVIDNAGNMSINWGGYTPHRFNVNGDILANGWIRTLGDTGLYSNTYGRGIAMPEAMGNLYGHITTYNPGRNGWSGYGIGSRFTLMGRSNEGVGMYDSSLGWLWFHDTVNNRFNIGTNSGPEKLNVYGTGDTRARLKSASGSASIDLVNNFDNVIRIENLGGFQNWFPLSFKFNGTERFAFLQDGNMLIGGHTSTGCILDGDWTVIAGTCASDARLKTNIAPLPSGILDKIVQLQPSEFEYVNHNGYYFPSGKQIGYIAQQVMDIFPDLVHQDVNGYYAVDYTGRLPIYMLQAIKELNAKVDNISTTNYFTLDSTYINTIYNINTTGNIYSNGLNIANGKLIIDNIGNLSTTGNINVNNIVVNAMLEAENAVFGKIKVDKISVNQNPNTGDASIGSATIPAGNTNLIVNNSNVTSKSKIFITTTSSKAPSISVINKIPGVGFEVEIPTPQLQDVTFDYWVIGE